MYATLIYCQAVLFVLGMFSMQVYSFYQALDLMLTNTPNIPAQVERNASMSASLVEVDVFHAASLSIFIINTSS